VQAELVRFDEEQLFANLQRSLKRGYWIKIFQNRTG
jgi:hypothetical protein